MSVTSKTQMFTEILSLLVFNFVYWLVNPLGTQCHCRTAGSGVQPQPGVYEGTDPLHLKTFSNCIHFIKLRTIK